MVELRGFTFTDWGLHCDLHWRDPEPSFLSDEVFVGSGRSRFEASASVIEAMSAAGIRIPEALENIQLGLSCEVDPRIEEQELSDEEVLTYHHYVVVMVEYEDDWA